MLRVTPKGEDGLKQGYQRVNGVTPPANEGAVGAQDADDSRDYSGDGSQQQDINYLHLVSLAEASAQTYMQQINRRARSGGGIRWGSQQPRRRIKSCRDRDDFSSIRHLALDYCWSMIVPTFRDHALGTQPDGFAQMPRSCIKATC